MAAPAACVGVLIYTDVTCVHCHSGVNIIHHFVKHAIQEWNTYGQLLTLS